jgi:dihydroorotate dehydrogenase
VPINLYPLAKQILFRLDPERAHHLTIDGLRALSKLGLAKPLLDPKLPDAPTEVMGITFPNQVGLAAGMDKAGNCVAGFGAMGFGHVEVGTVTPRPQPGNDKPRLFRLKPAEAIINRMGFNNPGIDEMLANLADSAEGFRGVLGINIGKNFDTPIERAADDYLICLRKAYARADYITVNFSSPNTKNLRELQEADAARGLLTQLKQEQAKLADEHGNYVPLAIKIAPDLEDDHIRALGELFAELEMDAVIATNTTISREAVNGLKHAEEAGGLSGKPVRDPATHVIQTLKQTLGEALPIIGVGGISCGADAKEKVAAGATLVQIYTGLIYKGNTLVGECRRALQA